MTMTRKRNKMELKYEIIKLEIEIRNHGFNFANVSLKPKVEKQNINILKMKFSST